jgi:hypothetical protein
MMLPGLFMIGHKSFKKGSSPTELKINTADSNSKKLNVSPYQNAKITKHNPQLIWWTPRLLLVGSFGLGVLVSRRLFRNRRY